MNDNHLQDLSTIAEAAYQNLVRLERKELPLQVGMPPSQIQIQAAATWLRAELDYVVAAELKIEDSGHNRGRALAMLDFYTGCERFAYYTRGLRLNNEQQRLTLKKAS